MLPTGVDDLSQTEGAHSRIPRHHEAPLDRLLIRHARAWYSPQLLHVPMQPLARPVEVLGLLGRPAEVLGLLERPVEVLGAAGAAGGGARAAGRAPWLAGPAPAAQDSRPRNPIRCPKPLETRVAPEALAVLGRPA